MGGSPPADTRKVSMQEIDFREFESRNHFWNQNGGYYHADSVYSEISSTITHELPRNPKVGDFVNFFIYVVGERQDKNGFHPDELRVGEGRDWICSYVSRLTGELLKKMGLAALQTSRGNFAQVKYKCGLEDGDRAFITFARENGTIVGRRVCVPFKFKDFFNIETSREIYTYARGVWVPQNGSALRKT